MAGDNDVRLLRVWTPRILRFAVAASAIFLVAGLGVIAATAPDSYVTRYRALQEGHLLANQEGVVELVREISQGRSRALLVAGLLMLTLVPIGRVAFAVLVFVRARDWPFAALTTAVLALLAVGVMLGRIG